MISAQVLQRSNFTNHVKRGIYVDTAACIANDCSLYTPFTNNYHLFMNYIFCVILKLEITQNSHSSQIFVCKKLLLSAFYRAYTIYSDKMYFFKNLENMKAFEVIKRGTVCRRKWRQRDQHHHYQLSNQNLKLFSVLSWSCDCKSDWSASCTIPLKT